MSGLRLALGLALGLALRLVLLTSFLLELYDADTNTEHSVAKSPTLIVAYMIPAHAVAATVCGILCLDPQVHLLFEAKFAEF